MEFIEADPLPVQCKKCAQLGHEEYNCEECDCLGLRFRLSEEDQRRLDSIAAEKQHLWRLKWKQAGQNAGRSLPPVLRAFDVRSGTRGE